MKVGPDISHYQSNVDLAKAKPFIDFIIFKATQGTSFVDPTFSARWDKARSLDIPRMAYHYAELGSSWDTQAQHFANTVRNAGAGGRWALALDLEQSTTKTSATIFSWADSWVRKVRGLLGRPVAFYTYPSYWSSTMGSPSSLPGGSSTVGWWARYSSPSSAPAVFGPPDIWQCSNGVVGCVTDIPGIGHVDYNKMTDAAFSELFGGGVGQDEVDAASVADIEKLFAKYIG